MSTCYLMRGKKEQRVNDMPKEGDIVKVTGNFSSDWKYIEGIHGLVLSANSFPGHAAVRNAEVMLFLNNGNIEIKDFVVQCWPGLEDLTVIASL